MTLYTSVRRLTQTESHVVWDWVPGFQQQKSRGGRVISVGAGCTVSSGAPDNRAVRTGIRSCIV